MNEKSVGARATSLRFVCRLDERELLMPNLTPCPTDDQLSQLAAGALTGDGLDVLERHLDGCVACRQVVAAVSNGSMPAMRPSDRPALRPGDRLGRYEIERLIGAGGMGMLYLARDPQLNRRVALKLMRPSLAAVGGRLRRLREAQAMAQLNHPNVVSVFDLGECPKSPW